MKYSSKAIAFTFFMFLCTCVGLFWLSHFAYAGLDEERGERIEEELEVTSGVYVSGAEWKEKALYLRFKTNGDGGPDVAKCKITFWPDKYYQLVSEVQVGKNATIEQGFPYKDPELNGKGIDSPKPKYAEVELFSPIKPGSNVYVRTHEFLIQYKE